MSDLRVLASGIDSLYVSVLGKLIDGLLIFFGDLRGFTLDGDIPLSLGCGELDLLLRTHGWRGYPWWFSSPAVGALRWGARSGSDSTGRPASPPTAP